jgi:hypothetical protein
MKVEYPLWHEGEVDLSFYAFNPIETKVEDTTIVETPTDEELNVESETPVDQVENTDEEEIVEDQEEETEEENEEEVTE